MELMNANTVARYPLRIATDAHDLGSGKKCIGPIGRRSERVTVLICTAVLC